ncbi:hypothetical protein Q9966_011252 [Columba livia]|nr:hypothetical protein Q9966_011252 [Columba livia]
MQSCRLLATVSSSPWVPQGLEWPGGGISIHWLPFINISGWFFPWGESRAVMESLVGGYITLSCREERQVALGGHESARAASCWLLTEPWVGHEVLLLGPAHPAAGGSLDWKPGCLLPQPLQHMLLQGDVHPAENPSFPHQELPEDTFPLLPQGCACGAAEGEEVLCGPGGELVPAVPAAERVTQCLHMKLPSH